MKKLLLLVSVFLIFAGAAFSENIIELKKAELSWSMDGAFLTIGVEAETEGWIAVGLGSPKMDDSVIFIGYSKDGEAYLEEHPGKGHSHKKAAVQHQVDYSVTESNGHTRLEVTVSKSDFIASSAKTLPVIVAYGSRDNFSSMHRYRESTAISF